MAMASVESWDDEFEGNFQSLATQSVGTVRTNLSSRMSVTSESLAGGDDDWNLVLQPDNEQSINNALASAQAAGIPLPSNVPQSALLGGTIKRLGKAPVKPRIDDDWEGDLEMPDRGTLRLKQPQPISSALSEEYDDFEEFEGSLGIRTAGTRRDMRNRSCSASAMSPSLGSVTAGSEDDELRGLELPEGPMDFDAMLKKRRAAEAELSDLSQPSPALEQPATLNIHKKSRLLADDNDDYLHDFDLGPGNVLDGRLRNVNRNVKVKNTKPSVPPHRPATTLIFHDKATDKPVHTRSHIPRPVPGSKPSMSRLEPVLESGASRTIRDRRQPPPTTGTQLLKSKRSLPALRSQHLPPPPIKSIQPLQHHGATGFQTQQATLRQVPYHLRRESDPRRMGAQSPPLFRPQSRLSSTYAPETPSRTSKQRADVAPTSLAREAASRRTITKPARPRVYGDGNELAIFDDLPTSMTKESKFVKQPVGRHPSRPDLRATQSRSDIRDTARRAIPDRMTTPCGPRTPAVLPSRPFYEQQSSTPSYLRDTAASRIARESRLGHNNPRPRSEGPLMPLSTNWKAQVAARSPHTSPSAQRQKPRTKQPQLIKAIGPHAARTEKGMVYNPHALRWEGNENTLEQFEAALPLDPPPPPPMSIRGQSPYMDRCLAPSASPPRPALIAPMSGAAAQGVQVNGGMVFDPRQMKWLKLKGGRDTGGPLSPSLTEGDDEEDAFAGIEDLKDDQSAALPSLGPGFASPVSMAAGGVGEVHEEFDLGPRFIEMQNAEEEIWRRRCAAWFPVDSEPRPDDGRWRWAIRDIARHDGEGQPWA